MGWRSRTGADKMAQLRAYEWNHGDMLDWQNINVKRKKQRRASKNLY